MKFTTRAANSKYKLTELENDLVTYIIQHKAEVVDMKIISLAGHLFTVPNTITRFCHKLGYSGFAELKIELKHELSPTQPQNAYRQIILNNFDLIDPEREQKTAWLLSKAKAVNFYAQDQTRLVAELAIENFQILDHKFRLLDYEKEAFNHIQRSRAELFFFISLTGETPTILSLARLAKAQGHKIISLTNLSHNSLSQLADLSLYCLTEPKTINQVDIADKTPLFIILHSLFEQCQKLWNNTPSKDKHN